ncbi:NAD-glutamate dehydrogenase [Kocuria rhizophila]|nr:NAD-glutamate dehydrogenase [Kocuria rhizophila]
MTGPEPSVLTVYAKIQLDGGARGQRPRGLPVASTALPSTSGEIRERFDAELGRPLRKEIISTVVANQIINFGGSRSCTAWWTTPVRPRDVARAFTAAMEIFSAWRATRSPRPVGVRTRPGGVEPDVAAHARLLDRVVRSRTARTRTPYEELVDTTVPSWPCASARSTDGPGVRGAHPDRGGARRAPRRAAGPRGRVAEPRTCSRCWTWHGSPSSRASPARRRRDGGRRRRRGGARPRARPDRGTDGNGAERADAHRAQPPLPLDRDGLENLLNRISALPQTTRWGEHGADRDA